MQGAGRVKLKTKETIATSMNVAELSLFWTLNRFLTRVIFSFFNFALMVA